jgi:hypothetical protein
MNTVLNFRRLSVVLLAWLSHAQNPLSAQSFVPHDIIPPFGYEHLAYIDADSLADMVLIQYGDLMWRQNDGTGTFLSPQPLNLPHDMEMRTLDIDQDGDYDALFLRLSAWYENDGAQNYTLHPITPAFVQPEKVYVRDVDSDTDIDFAEIVSVGGQYAVNWYMNNGNGDLTTQTSNALNLEFGDIAAALPFLAHIDNNGFLDLTFATHASTYPFDTIITRTAFNDGSGNFEGLVEKTTSLYDDDGNCVYGDWFDYCGSELGLEWLFVNSSDLDNDGDDEIMVGYYYMGFEDIHFFNIAYRNNEISNVWEIIAIHKGIVCGQESICCETPQVPLFAYDINHDNRQDLVGFCPSYNAYGNIRLQESDGSFAEPIDIELLPTNENRIFNIDNTGLDDVLYLSPHSDLKYNSYAAMGDTSATAYFHLHDPYLQQIAGNIQLVDFDNDGDKDMLFSTSQALNLLINLGDDTYIRKYLYTLSTPSCSPPSVYGISWFQIADINQDSLLDIALKTNFATSGGGYTDVFWLRNIGNNDFEEQQNITANETGIFLEDMDNDGDLDFIATRRFFGDTISHYVLYLQTSSGVFNTAASPPSPIPNGTNTSAYIIQINDIDQDGDKDLWLRSYNALWICLQNSDLQFGPPILLAEGISHLYIADLNGDGEYDAAYKKGNRIESLINTGGGTFLNSLLLDDVAPAYYPKWELLNADVFPDLVLQSDSAGYAPTARFNTGGGTIGDATPFPTDVMRIQRFGYLDDDQSNDLFYTDTAGALWLRQNDGQGGFAAYSPIFVASHATLQAIGDMDNDGKNDILCRNYLDLNPDGITYFANDGIVGISPATTAPTNAPISIYPNPATDQVTISVQTPWGENDTHLLHCSIYDPLGRVVKTIPLQLGTRATVSLAGLPSGVYFYVARSSQSQASGKFVKQ